MKNIHVLPTDKPSRLYKEDNVYKLDNLVYGTGNQNIYITSDEEIKEGDWILFQGVLTKALKGEKFSGKEKIILTTDQDLIKDGVQAIEDEFLEWFVKNPSCEEVDVVSIPRCCGRCNGVDDLCFVDRCCDDHHEYGCEICYGKKIEYKIIIPKEEPKQVGIDWSGFPKSTQEKVGYVETKQETIEEAVQKVANSDDFVNGALFAYLWQQERMYSEEEVKFQANKLLNDLLYKQGFSTNVIGGIVNEWFEQFKKK